MEYPMAQMGGVETLVRALVPGLAEYFEIVLVSDDTAETLAIGGWDRMIVAHERWNRNDADRASAVKLAGALKTQGVEQAHFHFGGTYDWLTKYPGRSPLLFTRRAGIRCLATIHLAPPLTEGFCHPARPLLFRLSRLPVAWLSHLRILSCVDASYAVSRADCARLRRIFFPMKGRIGQIYHSILDGNEVASGAPRKKEIITVGTIGPRKGQAVLVRAFGRIAPRHPEWTLRIIGRETTPGDLARLRGLVPPGLEERVKFAGRLPDDEMMRALDEASLFAMPSLQEGLGLSLQEALWHGCPAVGSRVGGIPELIDDGKNGLLVEPGSEDQLAEALEKLLVNEALLCRLATAAKPSIMAKGMTRQAMIGRYRAIYDEVL